MLLTLKEQIKKLPSLPGVYLFKDSEGLVIYIGKAKNLKKRVASYELHEKDDVKAARIFEMSTQLSYHVTKSELEALVLEAQLIRTHQPKLNVLLKEGQPFLYLMVTRGPLPELKIVRQKKQKGIYFGPFIEKGPLRTQHTFLLRTFRLKLCSRKIRQGCLYYHLGQCAGACRQDFDKEGYLKRLDLAVQSLRQGHRAFLKSLQESIAEHNKRYEFEKSKELHGYLQACQRVYASLQEGVFSEKQRRALTTKDVWIRTKDQKSLIVFQEQDGVLKRRHVFHLFGEIEDMEEYFKSFYREHFASYTILVNFDLPDASLYEQFLTAWQDLRYQDMDTEELSREGVVQDKASLIKIVYPTDGHFLNVLNLATIHAEQMQQRHVDVPEALKKLLLLDVAPHTIDCFDISQKQGTSMVGSCIRFTDGEPDKNKFRRFHVKTVAQQDDYAALREIVGRRYKQGDEPDLVLIDGGKGQRNACKPYVKTTLISLAKAEETIFSDMFPEGKKLSLQTQAGRILIALRDYAHHFAITFHRKIATEAFTKDDE